jgi:hypothetical protein
MQTSMAATALLMGLAGGPHCIAMCGAACAGIGKAAGERGSQAIWTFQLGRIVGYSLLGALAAASMQGLGWLTTQTATMRPVWTLFHVAVMILGLALFLLARQPVWLEDAARRVWLRIRGLHADLGPRGTAGHWRDVGIHALRTVVFSFAGRGAQWQRLGRGVGHGIVCAGEQRFSFGRPLGVAAVRQPGQWRLGRAPGGPGTCGHVRMGALDGPGA